MDIPLKRKKKMTPDEKKAKSEAVYEKRKERIRLKYMNSSKSAGTGLKILSNINEEKPKSSKQSSTGAQESITNISLGCNTQDTDTATSTESIDKPPFWTKFNKTVKEKRGNDTRSTRVHSSSYVTKNRRFKSATSTLASLGRDFNVETYMMSYHPNSHQGTCHIEAWGPGAREFSSEGFMKQAFQSFLEHCKQREAARVEDQRKRNVRLEGEQQPLPQDDNVNDMELNQPGHFSNDGSNSSNGVKSTEYDTNSSSGPVTSSTAPPELSLSSTTNSNDNHPAGYLADATNRTKSVSAATSVTNTSPGCVQTNVTSSRVAFPCLGTETVQSACASPTNSVRLLPKPKKSKEFQTVWQGMINCKGTGSAESFQVPCKILEVVIKLGLPRNLGIWPKSLEMRKISKSIVARIDTLFLENANIFVFETEPKGKMEILEFLGSSNTGFLHFVCQDSVGKKGLSILMAFNEKKDAFVGKSPRDCSGFITHIQEVLLNSSAGSK